MIDNNDVPFFPTPAAPAHDVIYAVRKSALLTDSMQGTQLKSVELNGEPHYSLDTLLLPEIILGQALPDGYEPLRVGMCIGEKVNEKVYFNVYQIPNGKLTIVPAVNMELSDTQFSDLTQQVSVARTILGVLFNSFENIEIPEIDYTNAYTAVGNALVFGFSAQTLTDSPNQQPFTVVGYNQSIGRVSLEEFLDDADNYDDLSVLYVDCVLNKGKQEQ